MIAAFITSNNTCSSGLRNGFAVFLSKYLKTRARVLLLLLSKPAIGPPSSCDGFSVLRAMHVVLALVAPYCNRKSVRLRRCCVVGI